MWASESATNQKYLEQFEIIFNRAASIKDWQTFDVDAAWGKMKSRISPTARYATSQTEEYFYFMRVAAGILIVLSAGIFGYKFLFDASALKPVEVIANRETINDTLPDGSNVFLNKETKLDYAFDKKAKVHKVKLRGEAYFHIKHEEEKKFLVEAEGIFIRDIGTSFNVTATPNPTRLKL